METLFGIKPQSVVLFGPPGCGKGTQAGSIFSHWKELGMEYIQAGTGDAFRKLIKAKPENETFVSLAVKKIVAAGGLVPDFLSVCFFVNILMCLNEAISFLADGFPRTKKQAEEFHQMMVFFKRELVHVIMIDVEEDVLVNRIVKRAEKENRPDDMDPKVVARRVALYREETEPVKEFFSIYKNWTTQEKRIYSIHEVNGNRSEEEVRGEIFNILFGSNRV
jgi:adenylate kinase